MTLDDYDKFCEAAMLNKKEWPYVFRRDDLERKSKTGSLEFAMFVIASCVNPNFWWAPFIGIEFIGIFPGKYGDQTEICVTRSLGHTKIVKGRGILMVDLLLV